MNYDVVIGDSRIELQKLPSNSFKACITSPPYNVSKKYADYVDRQAEWRYQKFLRDIFVEIYRVLTPDGMLFLNIADEAVNWNRSHDILHIMEDTIGYSCVHRVIWSKPSVQPLATDKQLGFSHELIFLLAKDRSKYRFNYYEPLDVFSFYEKKEEWETHPAVYPVELPIRCLKLITTKGDSIIDPFAGTFTTGLAARYLELNATGIEFSVKYLPFIKRKIRYGQSLQGGEHFRVIQKGLVTEEVICNGVPNKELYEDTEDRKRESEIAVKNTMLGYFE